jgi:hypothetical protein
MPSLSEPQPRSLSKTRDFDQRWSAGFDRRRWSGADQSLRAVPRNGDIDGVETLGVGDGHAVEMPSAPGSCVGPLKRRRHSCTSLSAPAKSASRANRSASSSDDLTGPVWRRSAR